jgi:putative ABC transport system permease protein
VIDDYAWDMSVLIAIKNLFQDKLRLFLSVLGVGLAVMLVLILNGFVAGLYKQVSAYLDHSPGSVVVAQQGVTNLLGATSLLPNNAEEKVLGVAGVSSAVPILSQFIILDLHEIKQPAYLIGYPEGDGDPSGRGGPWQIAAGREPVEDDEVVFDQVLAERHDLGIGDGFKIMGVDYEIVGLSVDTTSWMTSFIFMTKNSAESLLRAADATSILLVEVYQGYDVALLIDELNKLDGLDALTKAAVIVNDTKLLVEVFSAPLQLMAGIAFLVGVLVVGLVIYTATVERRREYGVLKAVGGTNRLLYLVVGTQAFIAAGVGGLGGIGLAVIFASGIMRIRPEFLILLTPDSAWLALGSGLAMAMLAALIPARAVASLEPADVFRQGG